MRPLTIDSRSIKSDETSAITTTIDVISMTIRIVRFAQVDERREDLA